MTNNIHEKVSSFWLVKSSAVVFKTVQKRVNSRQKEETNQAFLLVNDQRNSQMANQIFCFQIKRTPWMAQFFPDCVIYVRFFCLSISKFFRYIIRAVFKWLSKVITWLRLLPLVIGLKDSRQFFNQLEAKPKPIAPCTRDFYRASSELQMIASNRDWFIALSAPVVIGRSNCFGFGFSTVIWKSL